METELLEILHKIDFFQNANLTLERIQKQDKCFLIIDNTTGRKYKVRRNYAKNPDNADREFMAYDFIKNTPAIDELPRLRYFNPTQGIIISDWVDGDALNTRFDYDDKTICKIYDGIKQAVGKLHAVRADIASYPTQRAFTNWHDFFRYKLTQTIRGVPEQFFDAHLQNRIWRLFDKNSTYFNAVQTSIIHGDFRCHNVVYDTITDRVHLIDFESVMVGDPNFDLLRILCDEQLTPATGGRTVAEQNDIYVLYYLEMMLTWFGHSYHKYGIVEQSAIDTWNRLL